MSAHRYFDAGIVFTLALLLAMMIFIMSKF
jgi:hypothetical protein